MSEYRSSGFFAGVLQKELSGEKWNITGVMRISLLFLILAAYGCSVPAGVDDSHIRSCGPAALEEFIQEDAGRITKQAISEEILSDAAGNIGRNIFYLFNRRAYTISWPSEMISVLVKRGYEVEIIYGSHSYIGGLMDSVSRGIILLHSNEDLSSFHWMEFSQESEKLAARSWYDSDTILDGILIAKLRKTSS